MKKKMYVAMAVVLAVVLPGCEACNGGAFGESKKIAPQIIREAEKECGKDREHGRGGVENIMLMEGRADDGIVTCHDGTNHFFDG